MVIESLNFSIEAVYDGYISYATTMIKTKMITNKGSIVYKSGIHFCICRKKVNEIIFYTINYTF